MRVMCISPVKNTFDVESNLTDQSPPVEVGSFYTPVDCQSMNTQYGVFEVYRFAEIPPNPKNHWYDVNLFAPLSDADETELVNQKELTV